MTIAGKQNFIKHIKPYRVDNPDVTGAGDTVIAALSIAYAKTNDIEFSAKFANTAAAIAVGKTGTASVTIDEINNYIGNEQMKDLINRSIKSHSEAVNLIDEKEFIKLDVLIKKSLTKNNTIFWCGNGGSASQANHLSAELIGGMYKDKKSPFKSLCLNVDTAFMTTWSNDDSFDNIFQDN